MEVKKFKLFLAVKQGKAYKLLPLGLKKFYSWKITKLWGIKKEKYKKREKNLLCSHTNIWSPGTKDQTESSTLIAWGNSPVVSVCHAVDDPCAPTSKRVG